jgi:hypothetical protein
MRKLILCCTLFFSIGLFAQTKSKNIKQQITLEMPMPDDSLNKGTRGASVVWHPVFKKYYASFAGNARYPLAIFDAKGTLLSDNNLQTNADTRGLWYNPDTKLIYGNTYNENGWFKYTFNKNGTIADVITIFEGMHQPGDQSVAVYHTANKKVLFLDQSKIKIYNPATAKEVGSLTFYWGRTAKEGKPEEIDGNTINERYNYTNLIYTGIKSMEIGVLNKDENQIELYDYKNGFLTMVLNLPDSAVTEYSFNFAYANGFYWLFDIENRQWVGYK